MSAQTSERQILLLIAALCSVPLVLAAYGSLHARYIIDDYCSQVLAGQVGIFNYVVKMYTGWTGTFSALVLQGSIPSVQVLGVLVIFWLLIGLGLFYSAVKVIFAQLSPTSEKFCPSAAAAASVFFAALLAGLPSLHQSLFWYTAFIPYAAPLLLAPLLIILLFKASSAWMLPLLFVLCFALAGFNFGFTLALLVALSALLLATLPHVRLRARVFVGLLGAVLGAAVMILAPGNAIREAYTRTLFTVRADAVGAAIDSLVSALGMSGQIAHEMPLRVIAVCGLSALLAYYLGAPLRRRALWLIAVIVVAHLCIAATFFPIFYVSTEFFSSRTLTASIWISFLSMMASGYLYGLILRRDHPPLGYLPRYAQLIAIVLAVGLVLNGVPDILRAIERQAAFAAAWDERDAYLRTLSGTTEIVRARSFNGVFGLPDLTDDPSLPANACIADYYNLSAIVADDQPPFVP